ncbi:MAG: DDE-type integrase/transposase/recombinase [Candidatus Omnitrophica bacterium]|nr:DDE-type integrase/transposase/recombinase [Candidatus Omnitrophota bacterium]
MYVLRKEKVLTILGGLVEGHSIRALERMTGVNQNTIMSWLVRAGDSCHRLLDAKIQNIQAKYVQADELWSFIGKKEADPEHIGAVMNGYKGEVWVFVALDADTKLVISYILGHRDTASAYRLMMDLRRRLVGEFQLTTDGLLAYRDAAELAFGTEVHFGQLMKIYRGDEVVGARPVVVAGNPNVEKISTSYVERNNLTMRMSVRRLARKTSAFSKKSENHLAALHLYFSYYNFCRWHRTLKMTPAMAADLTDHLWTMEELVSGALKQQGVS